MKKKYLALLLGMTLAFSTIISANADTNKTGWVNSNGNWYYYYSNGSAATGWIKSGNDWYYLLKDGSMASNTKVDGYYLNSSGTWSTNAPSTVYTGEQIKQKLYSLGFVDYGSGITLNPYGATGGDNFTQMGFTVGSGNRDMSLIMYQSNAEIDKKFKTILNWILPTQGDNLYSVLDTYGLKSQTLELDGRTVNIRVENFGIVIDFSPIK